MKDLAVVLMSGGMDSTVCAGIALEKGFEVCALHVHYGQRTEQKEASSFRDICKFYNIHKCLDIDISHLSRIGGSSLTDLNMSVSTANLENEDVPTSYVPFRNANLLSIAVSWAEVLGANSIFIGAVEEDGSGYPDCRHVFFDAFEAMIAAGTKPETKIHIETPILRMKKSDIVKQGMRLGAPLHLTWSCYAENDVACGVCDSCALRLRGFSQVGIDDPIKYQQRPEYI